MFDWDRLKNGEIAVHCDTEEKANNFLKECYKQRVGWFDGDEATEISCWCVYRSSTTYACTHGYSKLSYGNAGHYKKKGLEIIDWRVEEMEKTFKEVIADIKEGEVWESNKMSLVVKMIEGRFYIGDKYDNEVDGFIGQYIPLTLKFKLKRKQYTFEEAFKAYEEGKEIESCVEPCKYKNGEFKANGDSAWLELRAIPLREIRGKWYIND